MNNELECEVCGGNSFIKESGFFYCNECQTQSQDIRDHVFEEERINIKSSRKIKQPERKKDITSNKITSWEGYNVILHRLTKQLIDLGAGTNLKQVVKSLWLTYLEGLEVIHFKQNAQPKLQLINAQKDARILYGHKTKKRKRKGSLSQASGSTLNSASVKRERTKKKRALAQAHYDQMSQKSNQEIESLHNQSLSSLNSNLHRSGKSELVTLKYNKYSIKEMRKKLSRKHCRKHKLDKDRKLTCHKLTHKSVSYSYKTGVHFLSPVKLYCLMYLGLLIINDKIQLSDLLRFIKEGHLTYLNYNQLFPEEYRNKYLNINNTCQHNLCAKEMRKKTAQLAHFLNVSKFVVIPDLVELCRKQCDELNLPDQIFSLTRTLILKTSPKLEFNKTSITIPNYEGRALSFIIFILKLLYGLDGVTEHEYSKYAKSVDNLSSTHHKKAMFDIAKWMEFAIYRQFVIKNYHFPTSYWNDCSEIDSNLFLNYARSINIKPDENVKLPRELKDYNEFLTKVVRLQDDSKDNIKFQPSLTPFQCYSQNLVNSPSFTDYHEILTTTFRETSLDFLLRPFKYLEALNIKDNIKNGGSNDNWSFEGVKNIQKSKHMSYSDNKLLAVQVVDKKQEENIKKILEMENKTEKKFNSKDIRENFEKYRKDGFLKNLKVLKKLSKQDLGLKNMGLHDAFGYRKHFIAYERYWLYMHMDIDRISKSKCDEYLQNFSKSFRIIFKECCRITEQDSQELINEFLLTEVYLVYVSSYSNASESSEVNKRQRLLNKQMQCCINQSKTRW